MEFNWDSLLTQEIDVNGVKLKTTDLLGNQTEKYNKNHSKSLTNTERKKSVTSGNDKYDSLNYGNGMETMFPGPVICGEDSNLSETSNMSSTYTSSFESEAELCELFEGDMDFLSKSQKESLFNGLDNSASSLIPEFVLDSDDACFPEDQLFLNNNTVPDSQHGVDLWPYSHLSDTGVNMCDKQPSQVKNTEFNYIQSNIELPSLFCR